MKQLLSVTTLALLAVMSAGANSRTPVKGPQRPRVTVWGSQVIGPAVVARVAPEYPRVRGRISGIVVLQVWLDERGKVVDVWPVVKGMPGFADAAIKAVRQWTFRPAIVKGAPMPSVYDVTLSYSS